MNWTWRAKAGLLAPRVAVAALVGLAAATATPAAEEPLCLSVYATAGDVLRHLAAPAEREKVVAWLRPLRVSRVFLEGRRGGEYVPPSTLREARDFLNRHGIACSGGIATVPGGGFGVRQQGGLDWLDWESPKTRRDVATFFAEDAPLFKELIVDDFFCTGDTSPGAEARRGGRSWSDYRRDLLVSLIDPWMRQPARQARPDVRLIIKFPQWYDRFQLFGYDPPRMSARFDAVWVGTEVRNPRTQRMGYVQPTQGYMNFRWLASVAGGKTRGAWFDHIECTPQNFVDQAFQSVLAGARELTLFRLGDLAAGHTGDARLAQCLPGLFDLAGKVRGKEATGVCFYKPPHSEAADNLYLMDYLGMIGLPIVPAARYPERGRAVFLGAQAAADSAVLGHAQRSLKRGATLIVTPAFVRSAGAAAARLAGVRVSAESVPATATEVRSDNQVMPLPTPLELDAGVEVQDARVLIQATGPAGVAPLLTHRREGRGQVLLLNVRTFSEEDFRAVGEWLLAPRPRGLPEIPQALADELRRVFLQPLGVELESPVGVAFYLMDRACCLYSFREDSVGVRLNGRALELPAHQWLWLERGGR